MPAFVFCQLCALCRVLLAKNELQLAGAHGRWGLERQELGVGSTKSDGAAAPARWGCDAVARLTAARLAPRPNTKLMPHRPSHRHPHRRVGVGRRVVVTLL